jgi:hypothetical protein
MCTQLDNRPARSLNSEESELEENFRKISVHLDICVAFHMQCACRPVKRESPNDFWASIKLSVLKTVAKIIIDIHLN